MSSSKIISDPDKNYILTGKNNKPTAFYVPDFQYSSLGRFILFRLINDRDCKMVITGKGKSTGTGKTTLAILLAKWINLARNDLFNMKKEWSSKEYSFMNVWEYLEKYGESDRGDCLITDELEYMADRRRSLTHENVKFSQAWSILRYKNVITIGTAPGLMDLDKRIPETADIWINVMMKGRANVYYMTVDDFEWTPEFKRFKQFGYRETLLWDSIEESEDYQYLKQTKEKMGVPGIDDMKQIDESDLEEQESNLKQKYTKNLLKTLHNKDIRTEFTQEDIADLMEYSQQQISKLERNMKKDDEL